MILLQISGADTTTVEFRNIWLTMRVDASFDKVAFDACVRKHGHDPENLRASVALLSPEEQAE